MYYIYLDLLNILENDKGMTPLIKATIHKHFSITKLLLEKCNVDVDAPRKVKFMGSVVDGVTALWSAAG